MNLVLVLLVSVHLMCVNVVSGGPILAAWLDWRGTQGDDAAAKAAAYLARAGKSVCVLERRTVLGGCSTTEEQPQAVPLDRVPSTVPSPNVAEVSLQPGYRAEVVLSLLNYPSSITFDP